MKKERIDNDKQNLKRTIKAVNYMMHFTWKRTQGKKCIVLQFLISVLKSLSVPVSVIIPGMLINELIGQRRIIFLLIYVAILVLIPFLVNIIVGGLNVLLTKLSLNLSSDLNKEFNYYVASMDYETLEKPDIQVLRTRAKGVFVNPLKTIEKIGSLISAIIGLIVVSSIIISLNPMILMLLCLIILINAIITKHLNYKLFLLGKKITVCDRGMVPFAGILTQIVYAKEVRLFDLKSYFSKIIFEKEKEMNQLKLTKHKEQNFASVCHGVTNVVQQIILYAYLIYCVIFHGLAVGDMSIFLSSISTVSSSLSKIINVYTAFANDSLNIQEMIDFLDIPVCKCQNGSQKPVFNDNSIIEFRNVSFKYPGSECFALKNVSITIRNGKKLCIVGENGAGKSTFINLLTRLYTPTEGQIFLDGIDINEYDCSQYQKIFAPVLQDFCLYELSLLDNIVLTNEYNQARVDDSIEKSGLSSVVNNWPRKHNTRLGKITDAKGVIPSGGEAQKIAIARALYREAPIAILDEPTASLDPLSEYEIYSHFHNMVSDRCAVIITHRLSAVQLSDEIAVFDNGSVVEYGTHKELYEKGGIYTEMFDKQAQFYRD